MEAAELLMQLGVKGKEIQELTIDVTSRKSSMENYISQWANMIINLVFI